MKTQITYFVHGTTTDNKKNQVTGWLPGKLSAVCEKQLRELAGLIKDKRFDTVFCFDLKWAVNSVETTFG
ncbi:MAG: histidine phosphatase family protein [Patescibacteria group bacterium]